MSLPPRFILAFPIFKNKYVHYDCYWVDMEKQTIKFTSDDCHVSHSGLSLKISQEDFGFSFAKARVNGSLRDRGYHDGMYVGDGVLNLREGKMPIRFHPVRSDFVTFELSIFDDSNLDEFEREISSSFATARIKHYQKSFQHAYCWNDNGFNVLPFNSFKEGFMAKLGKVFHDMSHSQVKFCIDRRINGDKFDSLEGIYEPFERMSIRSYFDKEPKKIYESIFLHRKQKIMTVRERMSLMVKSAKRFVKRHPTLATLNLLRLLASGFKPV